MKITTLNTLLAASVLATVLGLANSAQATVNYSDGNWGAPWSLPAQFSLGPGPQTETATTIPTGGNPGAFFQQETAFAGATGSYRNGIVNGYLFSGAANYDPSQPNANILSLDFSIDAQLASAGGGVTDAAPFLEQGGRFYTTSLLTSPNTSWTTLSSTGLTAANFGLLASDPSGVNPIGLTDFSQNPDFSSTGGLISFGFLSGHSTSLGGPGNDIIEDFDNWNLTLNTPRIVSPEPASALLLLTGITALTTRSRRRITR